MKLLIDDNGNAVLENGKPVYVHEDGKKIAFDAPASMAKIKELNSEAAKHRTDANSYKEKLEQYGELDPLEAKKAIETIKNFDDKKFVDAGEVESLKKSLAETFNTEKTALAESIATKDKQIHDLMIGSQFAKSAFLADKVILPPDMVQSSFEKNFKVEDNGKGGLVVNGYLNGEKIFSRERPGETADFEESLRTIIDAYPMKDRILKSSDNGGSGSGGGQNNTNGQHREKTTQEKYASGLAKLMN